MTGTPVGTANAAAMYTAVARNRRRLTARITGETVLGKTMNTDELGRKARQKCASARVKLLSSY
jgi:hypothetical protein